MQPLSYHGYHLDPGGEHPCVWEAWHREGGEGAEEGGHRWDTQGCGGDGGDFGDDDDDDGDDDGGDEHPRWGRQGWLNIPILGLFKSFMG